ELEGLHMQLDLADILADAVEGSLERTEADRTPGTGNVGHEVDSHDCFSARLRVEQITRSAQYRAFELQQLLLDRQAAAVPGQRSVAANDTVAWNDDRNGIAPIREADRAHALRIADCAGDFS